MPLRLLNYLIYMAFYDVMLPGMKQPIPNYIQLEVQ